MLSKPIAEINTFSGMSDQGGIYNIDGFSVEVDNGVSSLDENFLASEIINSSTTGYTNIGGIAAIKYVYPLPNSTISASSGYTLMLNDGCLLHSYDLAGSMYQGFVGGVSSSGTYLFCQKPDLFVLPSGNIIYSSSRHLTLGVRGLCKTTATDKIIDKAGRNFTTLGLVAGQKITNLKTGSVYTITSVSTTDSTNDTLNFTAIGATTNTTNDEFLGIVLTKWDFNYVDGVSGTPVAIPTFQGQTYQAYWSRPIQQYGDQYMILSGNYIALLANDEVTMDSTYKQLPIGYQGLTFSVNGSIILVSAHDINGRGKLLLWDGSTEGWNEIIDVATPPQSLSPYNNGWVYLSDGIIYFTDGRNTQKLAGFSDNRYLRNGLNSAPNNGIVNLKDVFYFAVRNVQLNRDINGVLVFDRTNGITQFKCKALGRGFAIPNCLAVKSNASVSSIYSTNNDIEIGCNGSLNNLNDFQSSSSTSDFKSFIYVLDFKQETQVKEVWLNLRKTLNTFFSNRALKNTTISVNYGNDSQPILKYGQIGSNTTTTATNPSGASYPGIVGEEIEITSGACAGQRTFITGITNPGTSSEAWTLSPALSTASASSSDIRVWSVVAGETKTLTLDQLNKPIRFNTNFIGSKMYLEVVVRGIANSFPVSITNIQLF